MFAILYVIGLIGCIVTATWFVQESKSRLGMISSDWSVMVVAAFGFSVFPFLNVLAALAMAYGTMDCMEKYKKHG
jgi:hypothetical protein